MNLYEFEENIRKIDNLLIKRLYNIRKKYYRGNINHWEKQKLIYLSHIKKMDKLIKLYRLNKN